MRINPEVIALLEPVTAAINPAIQGYLGKHAYGGLKRDEQWPFYNPNTETAFWTVHYHCSGQSQVYRYLASLSYRLGSKAPYSVSGPRNPSGNRDESIPFDNLEGAVQELVKRVKEIPSELPNLRSQKKK